MPQQGDLLALWFCSYLNVLVQSSVLRVLLESSLLWRTGKNCRVWRCLQLRQSQVSHGFDLAMRSSAVYCVRVELFFFWEKFQGLFEIMWMGLLTWAVSFMPQGWEGSDTSIWHSCRNPPSDCYLPFTCTVGWRDTGGRPVREGNVDGCGLDPDQR